MSNFDFFFPLDTDFYIKFSVTNSKTKALVTGAVITGQMKDFLGNNVGSSVTGAAVAGESGFYDITIPDTLVLIESDEYRWETTVIDGGNKAVACLEGRVECLPMAGFPIFKVIT